MNKMEILTSKWMMIAYIVITFGVILLILGKKSVNSEIIVNAPKEKIWQVLLNTEEYEQWNSVINSVEGILKEGERVKFMFHQEEGKSYPISAKVRKVETNSLLNQFGGYTGIITYNHTYTLNESDTNTKVIIHEEYNGLMVPFWNPKPVQKAYDRLNKDIKKRVESVKN